MVNLTKALNQLRQERRQAQRQFQSLDQAIQVLERLGGALGQGASRSTRRLSAEARKRIVEAQKKRWAKWRKHKKKTK